MGMWVGRGRKARAAYGFDDIALVPGTLTINPNDVDIRWELGGRRFEIPVIAAAMDGVVGPRLAVEMGRLGGLALCLGRAAARAELNSSARGLALDRDHCDPHARQPVARLGLARGATTHAAQALLRVAEVDRVRHSRTVPHARATRNATYPEIAVEGSGDVGGDSPTSMS